MSVAQSKVILIASMMFAWLFVFDSTALARQDGPEKRAELRRQVEERRQAMMEEMQLQMQPLRANRDDRRDQLRYLSFMAQLEDQRLASQAAIDSIILDMDRACKLEENQKKKLRLAGKGVVKKTVEQTTKRLIRTAQQFGFEFEPGNPPVKEGENALKGFRRGNAPMSVRPGDRPNVANDVLWTNAVTQVLTEEQQASLKKWNASRKTFARQAAVDHFVAIADRKLLLSSKQRDELRVYIANEYGDVLVDQMENRRMFRNRQVRGGEPDEVVEELQKILTPEQQKTWIYSFKNELNMMTLMKNRQQGAIPMGGRILLNGR